MYHYIITAHYVNQIISIKRIDTLPDTAYTAFMKQYIELINNILKDGTDREDRTGVGSRFLWGVQSHFDMAEGFPAVTVRPVPLRWVFEETMLFLRGETQTKTLEDKGITIWKGNTTREFLDNRGMHRFAEGDMGYGYGYQWRNFGETGRIVDENLDTVAYGTEGVDQINEMLESMISNPDSRRHLVSAWNPLQLPETALPPCHIIQHYNISNGRLNCLFWMRSNDVPYGLPFNIAQYGLLNLIFAKYLGLKPGVLVYQCSDSHIYLNQLEMAYEISRRTPQPLPEVRITKDLNSFEHILDLEWEDIEVIGYNPLPDFKNKPKMAV